MTSQKFKIIHAFDQASPHYETAAGLQKSVAENLAGRIQRLPLNSNPRVLEVGCGTGYLTRALMPAIANADWTVSDIAPTMVEHCRQSIPHSSDIEFIQMDGETPCVQGGFDLICASLVFQWFEDLETSLARLSILLRPGGHLAFATLVQGTFSEWRDVHRMFGLSAATPAFPSAATIDGFWPDNDEVSGEGSIEEEAILQTYDTAHDFLMTLKAIGATTPVRGHKPLSAGSMRRVLRHLDRKGSLKITYQVAYGMFTRMSS
ncbi:MAG: methyltransferase domain-containing protein [Rhodospirillales bacterium]